MQDKINKSDKEKFISVSKLIIEEKNKVKENVGNLLRTTSLVPLSFELNKILSIIQGGDYFSEELTKKIKEIAQNKYELVTPLDLGNGLNCYLGSSNDWYVIVSLLIASAEDIERKRVLEVGRIRDSITQWIDNFNNKIKSLIEEEEAQKIFKSEGLVRETGKNMYDIAYDLLI